jgi:probable HAF family extracellular repeat protein
VELVGAARLFLTASAATQQNVRPGSATRYIFLAAMAIVFSRFTFAQQVQSRYTVLDRGPALVRTLSDTPGLNNHGDIALWHSVTAALMPGVVFHGKEMISIDGDKDFSLVYPADINDHLTVAGSVQSPQDLRFTHAFEWSNNKLEILDSLGGSYSSAFAVNAVGEVVGSAQTRTGARHAVVWRTKLPQDLGLLAQGDYSSARDINDKGDIAGEANLTPNGKPQAFHWHAGKMQPLPDLSGGTLCSAQAINNRDEIVGSCDGSNGISHGVLWRNGSAEDLGTLGDAEAPSTALDINDLGQVVGSSEDDGKLRAFLWEKGKMINLNKLIAPNAGWTLLVASRINNHGEILGRGYLGGSIHAFVLQPHQPSPGK